jgi:hypothetical protein
MSNPTSNFNWQMPTNSDLVTDLPADFEVFGQAVDTSLADLKGGTTGQILSKATNTDMDFVWIANDQGDITGITATSPLTGGGTSGAVTVGIQSATTSQSGAVQLTDSTSSTSTTTAATPNSVKSAYDLANTANTTAGSANTTANSAYASGFTNNFFAGKNKVINGSYSWWQRGTTFTNPSVNAYTADRWQVQHDGTGATRTVSQQTFTPGTAPVAGYEGQYFFRYAVSVAGTGNTFQDFRTNLEDVRTFAGQTVTISFWAKADASRVLNLLYRTEYGSGGSSANQFSVGSVTLTTSWARYSVTYAVPSLSGLTVGSGSFGGCIFRPIAATAQTIDIWGVQIEAGSVATPFQTASGSIGGELALCQRYYWRAGGDSVYQPYGAGTGQTTSTAQFSVQNPVPMRVAPTSLDFSTLAVTDSVLAFSISAASFGNAGKYASTINVTSSGLTLYRPYILVSNNSTSGYLGLSAEL